ncbi:hypothetical protein L6164_002608 [Bauhinia variegata]|uniref:Uncharacterized protein n=1 Tax=Bauhinia variegata TaxID=167791 RepID=A0ACB9PYK7_BAUVA|nr:hypothetical protein L6164_002608 [Bauhinia variegata]
MEEIRQVALAYFNNLSEKEKKTARKFLEKMDADKDRKISLNECLEYLKKEGFPEISNRKIFEELDKDNSGCLDFEEAITLFYVSASGRPLFCKACQDFLKEFYFTCCECFDSTSPTYDLCITCFQEKKHEQHKHKVFCDNHALLASKKTTMKGVMKKLASNLAVEVGIGSISVFCTIM